MIVPLVVLAIVTEIFVCEVNQHVPDVPIEKNGNINPNYRAELLFGGSAKANMTRDEVRELLTKIFYKADVSRDGSLEEGELQKWISAQVRNHFRSAAKENMELFLQLDSNHDGKIDWENEYKPHWLLRRGYSLKKGKFDLARKDQVDLEAARMEFFGAAVNADESLNVHEFMTFQHPEHSHSTLLALVDDLLANIDENGDNKLSEKEFVYRSSVTSAKKDTAQELLRRRKEFREAIDLDQNGQLSKTELLLYVDPERGYREARRLILDADRNKDGLLQLDEVVDQPQLFVGSSVIKCSHQRVHDDL